MIAPPYTSDFVQLFLPILENDSIAGTIRTEGEHDPVAEFIGQSLIPCFSWPKTIYILIYMTKYFHFAQLEISFCCFSSLQIQLHHDELRMTLDEDVVGIPGRGRRRDLGYEPIIP